MIRRTGRVFTLEIDNTFINQSIHRTADHDDDDTIIPAIVAVIMNGTSAKKLVPAKIDDDDDDSSIVGPTSSSFELPTYAQPHGSITNVGNTVHKSGSSVLPSKYPAWAANSMRPHS
jgi:hypothetical protein